MPEAFLFVYQQPQAVIFHQIFAHVQIGTLEHHLGRRPAHIHDAQLHHLAIQAKHQGTDLRTTIEGDRIGERSVAHVRDHQGTRSTFAERDAEPSLGISGDHCNLADHSDVRTGNGALIHRIKYAAVQQPFLRIGRLGEEDDGHQARKYAEHAFHGDTGKIHPAPGSHNVTFRKRWHLTQERHGHTTPI